MGFTMAEKKKIGTEYTKRYRKAKEAEKTKILDEYLKLVGKGNRKYAIFILTGKGKNNSVLLAVNMSMSKSTAATAKKGFTRNTTMRK